MQAQETKREHDSRKGKHLESKTLLGAYVTDEVKALAVMTADRLGITITDALLNGLRSEARRAGITDINDKIFPQYRAAYNAVKEMCVKKRTQRRSK